MSIQFSKPLNVLGSAAPVTIDEAKAEREKLLSTLPEITQARKWVEEYGDINDLADLEILEGKVQGTLALLDHFLATGEWTLPGGSATAPGSDPNAPGMQGWDESLQEGWNGEKVQVREDIPGSSDYNDELLQRLGRGAEFKGFVYYDSETAFVAHKKTKRIDGYLHGKDLIQIETYIDPNGVEKKQFWVVRDYVTKVQHNFYFFGHTAESGITMDFGKTFRLGDGKNGTTFGQKGMTQFVGTDDHDTIIGGQGQNVIYGLRGSDTLTGGASDDVIYGDDPLTAAERGQLGLRIEFPENYNNDDTIDGGLGKDDDLYGGVGFDTGVKGDIARKTDFEEPEGIPSLTANVRREDFLVGGADGSIGWGEGADGAVQIRPGVWEIRETALDPDNKLILQMPPGFEMAFAEKMEDGSGSIKITLLKLADGAPPETLTLIIKDALVGRTHGLESPMVLEFRGNDKGNTIDFLAGGSLDFANNTLIIKGGGGSDTIIAPTNSLVKDGLRFADLTSASFSVSSRQLENFKSNIKSRSVEAADVNPDAVSPIEVKTSENGKEIVIDRTIDNATAQFVHINPDVYDHGYVLQQGADLILVLVKKGMDKSETLTIRFKDWHQFQAQNNRAEGTPGHMDLSWLIVSRDANPAIEARGLQAGSGPIQAHDIEVLPLKAEMGTMIFGGEDGDGQDQDYVFHADGDLVDADVENDVPVDYREPTEPQDPPADDPADPVDPPLPDENLPPAA